jgi:hypothetical protein
MNNYKQIEFKIWKFISHGNGTLMTLIRLVVADF